MNIPLKTIFLITISALMGAALVFFLQKPKSDTAQSKADEPLYWVAPMDPNFKRDKPGKSPMGMDLVPVYAEEESTKPSAEGEIYIRPNVVNNIGVREATAVHKTLRQDIKTVGYVQYDENKLIHVHPRVEGWVEKLYVKATGDPVKKGEPLYSLYSPTLVNVQEELLLTINGNNEYLIAVTEERMRTLKIPESFITQFRKDKKVQQRVIFSSPQNGVIDNLNIREGFYVQPGTTLMSIGNLDEVWVEAEIFERQAMLVEVGLPVSMTLDYFPSKIWKGEVDYIYPTLDANTRTLRVRLRFANKEHLLKPNMFAEVKIHGKQTHALVIPKEALIRTGNEERAVLSLGGGKYQSVAVTSGRHFDAEVEILDGLNEGDLLVSSAQFLLDSESHIESDLKRMDSSEHVPDHNPEHMHQHMHSEDSGND